MKEKEREKLPWKEIKKVPLLPIQGSFGVTVPAANIEKLKKERFTHHFYLCYCV